MRLFWSLKAVLNVMVTFNYRTITASVDSKRKHATLSLDSYRNCRSNELFAFRRYLLATTSSASESE